MNLFNYLIVYGEIDGNFWLMEIFEKVLWYLICDISLSKVLSVEIISLNKLFEITSHQ